MEIGPPGDSANLMGQAQYGYDGDGRLTALNYPGALNPVASLQTGPGNYYQYDLLSRQIEVDSGSNSVLATNKLTPSSLAYTAAGQLLSWQEGAVNLNRNYDANRGWMTGLTVQNAGNSIVNQNYAYNPAGQLTTATDNVRPTLTASYGGSQAHRLPFALRLLGPAV
jgi:hypothetical protein